MHHGVVVVVVHCCYQCDQARFLSCSAPTLLFLSLSPSLCPAHRIRSRRHWV